MNTVFDNDDLLTRMRLINALSDETVIQALLRARSGAAVIALCEAIGQVCEETKEMIASDRTEQGP